MACCPRNEKYGYEDSRFEKDVDEDFHCSICFNVLKDPRTCKNNDHAFCLDCISEHLRVNSETCPECKEDLTVATLRRPRFLNNRLSKLKINCNHASRGCLEYICVEDLESHAGSCGFAPVMCSNENCGMVIDKQEIEHHETVVCEYRKEECLDRIVGKMEGSLGGMNKKINEKVETLQGMNEMVDILIAGNNFFSETPESEEIFSWEENGWFEISSMNEQHVVASSFIYEDQLFVLGGYNSKTIETLNLNELPLKWKKCATDLPYPCYGHQTVVHQQRVIHIGGHNDNIRRKSDVISELQLTSSSIMKELCRMPESRYHHGAEIVDDKVLIFGGDTDCGNTLASVLEFDPKKNECKRMPPLPYPLSRMATVHWRDQAVLLGGFDEDGKVLNDVLMYDCKTGKITVLPSMLERRYACCAVITGNTIVVMGGTNEKGKYLNSVECFTMGGSTWEHLPDMNIARTFAVAEVLPSTGKYV